VLSEAERQDREDDSANGTQRDKTTSKLHELQAAIFRILGLEDDRRGHKRRG
jgi:hypothetical protein